METTQPRWGTTRSCHHGTTVYYGRVHIVRPGTTPHIGWCGLPVDAVWDRRPPPRCAGTPEICPECTISYLAAAYPADPTMVALSRNHPEVP
jgi:hypothetical protein